LEDVFYRLSQFGSTIELGKARADLAQNWPGLDKFHVAIAKNGGPIALMWNDANLLIGQ
jgi:hypothetical protein